MDKHAGEGQPRRRVGGDSRCVGTWGAVNWESELHHLAPWHAFCI